MKPQPRGHTECKYAINQLESAYMNTKKHARVDYKDVEDKARLVSLKTYSTTTTTINVID